MVLVGIEDGGRGGCLIIYLLNLNYLHAVMMKNYLVLPGINALV